MSRWAPQPSPPCSVRELISAWMTLSAQVACRCRLQQGWWETQLPCGAKDGRRRRATRAQTRVTSASAHRGWRVTCYDTPRAHRKRWLAWHVASGGLRRGGRRECSAVRAADAGRHDATAYDRAQRACCALRCTRQASQRGKGKGTQVRRSSGAQRSRECSAKNDADEYRHRLSARTR